jgi:hypothetical protein
MPIAASTLIDRLGAAATSCASGPASMVAGDVAQRDWSESTAALQGRNECERAGAHAPLRRDSKKGKRASLDWRPLRVCLCNGDRSDSASIPVHQRDRPSSERELVVVKKNAIDGAMPHPFGEVSTYASNLRRD